MQRRQTYEAVVSSKTRPTAEDILVKLKIEKDMVRAVYYSVYKLLEPNHYKVAMTAILK